MRLRRHLLAGVSLAAGFTCLASMPAGAVTDEIIVTAQKREESILKVPLSISAVSGTFLDDNGISDLDEVSDYVPGFQMQQQSVNTPSYVIRGISSDVSEPNTEPNISVFFDGIPGSRGPGSVIELFDMDRIEVAKGPQGTLFSRGASNGAINFIMKKPEEGFHAKGKADFGNYDSQRYEGVVNVPLSGSTWLARFGAVYDKRDGYSENPVDDSKLNGKDTLQLRASTTVRPSDVFEYTVLGYYQEDEPDPTGFKTLVPTLAAIDPNTGDTDPYGSIAQSPDIFLERSVWGVTGLGEWELSDAWTFASTTGYREYESDDKFDPDGIGPTTIILPNPAPPPATFPLPVPFILEGFEGDDGNVFSHEFRLNFDNGGRLRAFAGVSYYHEEANRNRTFSYNQNAIAVVFGIVPPALLTSVTESTFTANENTSYSVFGDVSFDVTETVTLTGGLRWTIDEMEYSYRAPTANPPSVVIPFIFGAPVLNPFSPGFPGSIAPPIPPIPAGVETNALEGTSNNQTLSTEDEFDYLEPRIILSWDFAPEWMAYASWSSGVRSGGLDIDPRNGATEAQYRRVIKPERVTSYELGAKGSFDLGEVAFTTDGAVFYYDYEDFQSLIVTTGSLTPVNTGKASAFGAEASLTVKSGGFSAFGNVGYLDGQYDEGLTANLLGAAVDLKGNSFRVTPKWTLSAGLAYEHQLLQELSGYASLLASYKSSYFFNPENEPDLKQDSLTLVTLSAGLKFQERWDLHARVENLFDEDYLLDAGNTGRILGIPTSIRGQPRLWSIGIGVKF